jgi:hypothetical protein
MTKRLPLALLIGLVIGVLPYIADSMHSRLYPGVLEYVWIPGLFITSFVYPEGVHTGSGTATFLPVAVAANVLFYCIVAWLAIWLYSRMTHTQSAHLRK